MRFPRFPRFPRLARLPRLQLLPACLLITPLLAATVAATEIEAPREWLVIGRVNERGRRPFNPDAIFRRYLLDRAAPPPREGEMVEGDPGRSDRWKRVQVDEKGRVGADAAGGVAGGVVGGIVYAYAPLVSARARFVLARLLNGAVLYLNGAAFVGDIYGAGHAGVPVPLRKGVNHLFVRGVRGAFKLELTPIKSGVSVLASDPTLPDAIVGRRLRAEGAVVVVNASSLSVPAVLLAAEGEVAGGWTGAPEGLVPFGLRKLPVRLARRAPVEGGEIEFRVRPSRGAGADFRLHVREPSAPRRVTFRSAIDGSVQQYAVQPPVGDPVGTAIVLSLHGAGVDALSQARAYSPREGFWLVAPTNRRPFGFDWQDWGRADAYEVLEHAIKTTGADAERVYLTGHSMGGHGTWHLSANDPDRFLASAPSAGWATFRSYVGVPDSGLSGLSDLWRGADGASETLGLLPNLVQVPLFILHGIDDDNVPLREALMMETLLTMAGAPPAVHYQPGAGHWWDGDQAPGTDCVDWPGIFAHFERYQPRPWSDSTGFLCADPGVDSEHQWLRIVQPAEYGRFCSLRAERAGDEILIKTRNVRAFEARPLLQPVRYVVDGEDLGSPFSARFLRTPRGWRAGVPGPGEKRPGFSGPFKRAFDRDFLLVYGAGDVEGMQRARYDAQSWWYRGNGDAPVVSDAEFLRDGGYPGRNVILYGNADTNAAWARVLGEACPIRIRKGSISLGDRIWSEAAMSAVFVWPRQDDPGSLAGVFGHSDASGARLGYNLLPFVSGVGYPDFAIFGERVLAEGDAGVLAAGWFGHDWSLGG